MDIGAQDQQYRSGQREQAPPPHAALCDAPPGHRRCKAGDERDASADPQARPVARAGVTTQRPAMMFGAGKPEEGEAGKGEKEGKKDQRAGTAMPPAVAAGRDRFPAGT